ncbi:hypothetical protein QN416_25220, partial [Glaciimonas sp. Cout2]
KWRADLMQDLGNGAHQFRITETDLNGKTSQFSDPLNFQLDATDYLASVDHLSLVVRHAVADDDFPRIYFTSSHRGKLHIKIYDDGGDLI